MTVVLPERLVGLLRRDAAELGLPVSDRLAEITAGYYATAGVIGARHSPST